MAAVSVALSATPSAGQSTAFSPLTQTGAALRARILDHNARCSRVPASETALVSACTREKADLAAAIAAYQREVTAATNKVPQIGAAASVRGDVFIEVVPGERVRLAPGDPVRANSHMFTGANGRVQLLLVDKTTFVIGPDSDMVLDAFVYDTDHSAGKVMAEVAKGLFRFITAKIGGTPRSEKVVLPVMIIGIRGTDVEAYVARDGSGWVKLHSGAAVMSPKAGGADVLLAAGQMVVFDASGKPAAPVPINASLGPVVAFDQ
jgi:hypothetical protein